ncbi:MAG: hypothetical protein VX178_07290, partial [Pseudomonadota bacterium]|nr:hypothetical protein [Pseudomonadota bacterium]
RHFISYQMRAPTAGSGVSAIFDFTNCICGSGNWRCAQNGYTPFTDTELMLRWRKIDVRPSRNPPYTAATGEACNITHQR